MILSLDSSVVIDLMRGREAAVRRRFLAARDSGAEFKLSAVALYELAVGARKSERPDEKLEELDGFLNAVELAPFDGEDAMVAGAIRAGLETPGLPIDTPDLMIGAQALNRQWGLVSSNIRHFGRFGGLKLYDWRVADEPLDQRYIMARLLGRTED